MKSMFLVILFSIATLIAVGQKTQKVGVVAFYNLENLFDTIDGTNNDAEFLPNGSFAWGTMKYNNKLENMSKVISQIGDTPDGSVKMNGPTFLGVSEIENRTVLEDLINTPLLKDQNYEIVHFDSPDKRGVDVGFLYKSDYFKLLSAKSHFLLDPEDTTRRTRDQLLVSGIFDGDTLHFIVNHWPSRAAVSQKRVQAAQLCRSIVDSILNVNVNAKIFVMGDFNDSPIDPSLNWLMHKSEKRKPLTPDVIKLHNEGLKWHKKGVGTLAHNDIWQVFDMIIVTPGVMNDTVGFRFHSASIFDRPWLHQTDGRFKGYPLRTHAGGNYLNGYSDHLAVYMYIVKDVVK
ncbi:MAG: endonuclease/exonuclease/phosphatase family protein [Bacteroidia bacterium]